MVQNVFKGSRNESQPSCRFSSTWEFCKVYYDNFPVRQKNLLTKVQHWLTAILLSLYSNWSSPRDLPRFIRSFKDATNGQKRKVNWVREMCTDRNWLAKLSHPNQLDIPKTICHRCISSQSMGRFVLFTSIQHLSNFPSKQEWLKDPDIQSWLCVRQILRSI